MRHILSMLVVLIFSMVWGSCGKSGDQEHVHDEATEVAENESGDLYDEVMKLHDEGMEKMNEIYSLKEQLKEKITDTPGLVAGKEKEIENTIIRLDSASRAMMVWMRNFHPENDTLDATGYRDYLKSELEKVKKVRDDIYAALERAREE